MGRSGATSSGGTPGRTPDTALPSPCSRSAPERQHHREHGIRGRCHLLALDRCGRVDVLRTDHRAFPDERAVPDAPIHPQGLTALRLTLVARVEVVPAAEG